MKHSFEELEALNQIVFEFQNDIKNLPIGFDPEFAEAFEDALFEREQIESEMDYLIFG